MTTEALELAIASLFPGAGYCIEPEVLVKPDLPRRVTIKVHVWTTRRTLIHQAATNEEILALLKQDIHAEPSRVTIGSFTTRATG